VAAKKAVKTKTPTLTISRAVGPQPDPAVVAFLRDLDHPMKKEIETARKIILGIGPDIGEGIKWNAPSFRAADYFATINLRSKDALQLIFHTGAKVKETKAMRLTDPDGLVQWLAKDRCFVTLGAGKSIQQGRTAFEQIVREWMAQL
jgi:hypothetical protein